MNKQQIAILLFFPMIAASVNFILRLPFFAETAGGACNAGPAMIFIGFFFVICLVLSISSNLLLLKVQYKGMRSVGAIVMSCIASVIWCLLSWLFLSGNDKGAMEIFLPYLVSLFITVIVSLRKSLPV